MSYEAGKQTDRLTGLTSCTPPQKSKMASSSADHSSTTNPTPPFPLTPILTLSKIIIRPYHPSDAPAASRNGNDASIARYMTNAFPSPYELHHAESFIKDIALAEKKPTTTTTTTPTTAISQSAEEVLLHYALCRRSDGAYIGGIGLKPRADVEARTWELGYWIGKNHWGQGYMTEAVVGFSEWALRTFPELLRLEAGVYGGNEASMRVLRKAGYREEGTRRKAIWKNGKALDHVCFGMLREECPGLTGEAS